MEGVFRHHLSVEMTLFKNYLKIEALWLKLSAFITSKYAFTLKMHNKKHLTFPFKVDVKVIT